ncbi:methyl-accepting chemotaxis protein [Desulfovibrio ferrophilus]|uniref:Methyl-accepting chemotaxis protein n=1 Tax=Desulfovibrio ferrophilus TaxID=241368 RepID=A0A2Z6AZJ8_9BACT|nr:methyl-accepting chemotaxis protein [Desulfovibrio ferrophilus]BBD08620.1 methyl-accepting chemotaxis protein [Desulfovibrio ferrophilus]
MLDYFRSHVNARVTALVIGICVLVFAALITISSMWQSDAMEAQLDASLTRTSELIKQTVEKPMVIGDDASTKKEFAFLKDKYPDTEIYLTNYKANVTYSTVDESVRKDFESAYDQADMLGLMTTSLSEQTETGLLTKSGGRDLFMRVMSIPNEKSCYHCHGSSQAILGSIAVIQDVSPNVSAIRTQIYEFIALCVGGLILLVVPVVLFLRRNVIARLADIAGASNEVANGNFDARFECASTDELGQLGCNLSGMVGKLKTQLGFSQGILSGMTIACYVADTDANVSFINKPMLELIGLDGDPESFHGRNVSDLFFGDSTRETVENLALNDRKPHSVPREEYENRKGQTLFLNMEAAPLYDLDGNLIGAFALIMDLTAIVENERMIEAQNMRIAKAAGDAEQVSVNVSSSADELSAQVEEASRGSDGQLARTSEVATAMEQMNATVLEVAQNADSAAELADRTKIKAQEGQTVVEESVRIAEHVATQAMGLQESMKELGSQAEDVGRIVEVITDIADQTNLLALNAAIEAARAGEAGRGFAVVADEVRKLAERTMSATQEVTQSIQTIQNSAKASVASTEEAVVSVEQSREKAHVSGEALAEILGMVENTADQVRSIATAAEEQSATSEQITRSTEDINSIANETAQAMTEAAKAVNDLAEQAQALRGIIEDMRSS